jgi:hypothetical protein
MSASLPRQECARHGASSRTNRARTHSVTKLERYRRRQGTSRRLVPLSASEHCKAVRSAHGRRTEPVARRRCLETQARCLNATREHSTEQNSGKAGNERRNNCPFARLGSSLLAAGRAAGTNDGELPRSRTQMLRRVRLDRCSTHPRLCTLRPACEPPNVGHERRLEAGEACRKTSARWKGATLDEAQRR